MTLRTEEIMSRATVQHILKKKGWELYRTTSGEMSVNGEEGAVAEYDPNDEVLVVYDLGLHPQEIIAILKLFKILQGGRKERLRMGLDGNRRGTKKNKKNHGEEPEGKRRTGDKKRVEV